MQIIITRKMHEKYDSNGSLKGVRLIYENKK